MSEAIEYHIYHNEEGNREREAVVPGDAFDIDALLRDFDSAAFVEAVHNEPGEYIVVCYRPQPNDSHGRLPSWLYRVEVSPPESPTARVTAVGARA